MGVKFIFLTALEDHHRLSEVRKLFFLIYFRFSLEIQNHLFVMVRDISKWKKRKHYLTTLKIIKIQFEIIGIEDVHEI